MTGDVSEERAREEMKKLKKRKKLGKAERTRGGVAESETVRGDLVGRIGKSGGWTGQSQCM